LRKLPTVSPTIPGITQASMQSARGVASKYSTTPDQLSLL
jgi:hypothetical protein